MSVERNRKRKARQPSATAEERQVGQEVESPLHDEWLLDEALAETFPASDPISPTGHNDRSSDKHAVAVKR
jgi:hypothetical protein